MNDGADNRHARVFPVTCLLLGMCCTLGTQLPVFKFLPGVLLNDCNPFIGPFCNLPCMLARLIQAGSGFLLTRTDNLCSHLLGRQYLVHGRRGAVRDLRLLLIVYHDRAVPCGIRYLPVSRKYMVDLMILRKFAALILM